MDSNLNSAEVPQSASDNEAITHLRNSLESGCDWPTALLEAMALWTVPRETYQGRDYNYFIEGEAFDWLLLAERLSDAVNGLIPHQEIEDLLFTGKFPDSFDETGFKDLIGADKHRGYLNFYYGVVVEEALQLAVEQEVHKRYLSNGIQYQNDFSDDVCMRIYRESMSKLFEMFQEQKGYPVEDFLTLGQLTEFTYWLFKYRLKESDKAKIASDTRKGLQQLEKIPANKQAVISYA